MQVGSRYIALFPRYFLYFLFLPDNTRNFVNKFFSTKYHLTFCSFKRRLLHDSVGNKFSIFAEGVALFPSELRKYPFSKNERHPPIISCGHSIAAPFPFIRRCHNARSHRVEYHVAGKFEQIAVFFNENRLISSL